MSMKRMVRTVVPTVFGAFLMLGSVGAVAGSSISVGSGTSVSRGVNVNPTPDNFWWCKYVWTWTCPGTPPNPK